MTQTTPRASVLLLAYNQQDYVRKAIECAFAQDAEGIEIILSDDCSTDGTFEVMRAMAQAYTGPHAVRLNRNPKNLGVNDHTNFLVETASADICVPVPGDDYSKPNRVSRLLQVLEAEGTLLAHSDADTIGADGNPTEAWHKMALFTKKFIRWKPRDRKLFIWAQQPGIVANFFKSMDRCRVTAKPTRI